MALRLAPRSASNRHHPALEKPGLILQASQCCLDGVQARARLAQALPTPNISNEGQEFPIHLALMSQTTAQWQQPPHTTLLCCRRSPCPPAGTGHHLKLGSSCWRHDAFSHEDSLAEARFPSKIFDISGFGGFKPQLDKALSTWSNPSTSLALSRRLNQRPHRDPCTHIHSVIIP